MNWKLTFIFLTTGTRLRGWFMLYAGTVTALFAWLRSTSTHWCIGVLCIHLLHHLLFIAVQCFIHMQSPDVSLDGFLELIKQYQLAWYSCWHTKLCYVFHISLHCIVWLLYTPLSTAARRNLFSNSPSNTPQHENKILSMILAYTHCIEMGI